MKIKITRPSAPSTVKDLAYFALGYSVRVNACANGFVVAYKDFDTRTEALEFCRIILVENGYNEALNMPLK